MLAVVQVCNISYVLQLDVKEAPEVPTEHPQWDLSEEEEESRHEGEASDVSEFTTDEDVED